MTHQHERCNQKRDESNSEGEMEILIHSAQNEVLKKTENSFDVKFSCKYLF